PETVEVHLSADLAAGIGGDRGHGGRLGDGRDGGGTVDGAAGGREDDLAGSGGHGRAGHGDGAEDVRGRVAGRVVDTDPHVDLGGEMEDHLGGETGEDRGRVVVPEVEDLEVGPALVECRGQIALAATAEIVDDEHTVAVRPKPVDERRSDESGTAGDQRMHGRLRFSCPYARMEQRRKFRQTYPELGRVTHSHFVRNAVLVRNITVWCRDQIGAIAHVYRHDCC